MRIAPKSSTKQKTLSAYYAKGSSRQKKNVSTTTTTTTTKHSNNNIYQLFLATGIGFSLGLIVMYIFMFHNHFVFQYLSTTTQIETTTTYPQHHQKNNNNNNNNDNDNVVVDISYLINGEEIFLNTANSLKPTSDKVTSHSYQHMYGQFLLPYYYKHPKMKMLEIGLGCDMNYGPGASIQLYKTLFPKAQLWEAEYDGNCVNKHLNNNNNNNTSNSNSNSSSNLLLEGINILIGDQGNVTTLEKWIDISGQGGNFDIIIDDGGHENCQIWTSFQKLWPTIKPGGLYFIEDLHIAKNYMYTRYTNPTCSGSKFNMPNKIKDEFVDNLIYTKDNILMQQQQSPSNNSTQPPQVRKLLRELVDDVEFKVIQQHPKNDIKFVYCQRQACVIGKHDSTSQTIKSKNSVQHDIFDIVEQQEMDVKSIPVEKLWVGGALIEEPEPHKLDINATVVISYCRGSLHWLLEYLSDYKFHMVTVVSKCGSWPEERFLPKQVELVEAPNIGRVDHTMAYWMAEKVPLQHYDENEVIIFLKDNMVNRQRDMPELLSVVSANGFACSSVPLDGMSVFHETDVLTRFSMPSYKGIPKKRADGSFGVNKNDHFKSEYENMAAWLSNVGISLPTPLSPVCYEGSYAVKTSRIAALPMGVRKKLKESLSREDNIEEGHFAERTWAALFSQSIGSTETDLLLRKAKYVDHPGLYGFLGALMLHDIFGEKKKKPKEVWVNGRLAVGREHNELLFY